MSGPSVAPVPETPKNDTGELLLQVQDLQRRVLMLEQRLGDSTSGGANSEIAAVAQAQVLVKAAERPFPPNTLSG